MSGDARPTLRLGTRRSPLALHQAHLVRDAVLEAEPSLDVELVEIVSDGDTDPRELREIGERGIFAHALERELAAGRIDAAVHSSKDLELASTNDLQLVAWLPRADPRDAFVGSTLPLRDLPDGARIATGSARRGAALRTLRGDLVPVPVRGNVQGRIERARERGDAGCLLAMAGLLRLGLVAAAQVAIEPLPVEDFVPEAGQGAVVVQARAQLCASTGFDWSRVDDVATRRAVQLERELARLLGGGCEQPVGVHVELEHGIVHAFAATSPDIAGTYVRHDAMSTELGTLVSVSSAADVDEAAAWTAAKLVPLLARELGLPAVTA